MVNPLFQGLKAKYSWMAVSKSEKGNGPLQAIKKIDLKTLQSLTWNAGSNCFVGEPLMVPRPGRTEEDDDA